MNIQPQKKKKPLYELLENLKKLRIGYKKLICMCHRIMSYTIVGDVYQKIAPTHHIWGDNSMPKILSEIR